MKKTGFFSNTLASESLASRPTDSVAPELIFQGLMSKIFLISPILDGNEANHQSAGFSQKLLIKGGLFMF